MTKVTKVNPAVSERVAEVAKKNHLGEFDDLIEPPVSSLILVGLRSARLYITICLATPDDGPLCNRPVSCRDRPQGDVPGVDACAWPTLVASRQSRSRRDRRIGPICPICRAAHPSRGGKQGRDGNTDAIGLSVNLTAGWNPIRVISLSPRSPIGSLSVDDFPDERSAPGRNLLPFPAPTSVRRMAVLFVLDTREML
jgi:hypothetical protein